MAQEPDSGTLSREELIRQELLKDAVAKSRGEITAMEPLLTQGRGVIIGYSSGAVLNCSGDRDCVEFGGTPSSPVEHIAISKRASQDVAWVAYGQGALYQCTRNQCRKFDWDGAKE
jgi:hypothetical protein